MVKKSINNDTPEVNGQQMAAIMTFICILNLSALAKKTLIWLLNKTESLTKSVEIKFPVKKYKLLGKELEFGAHALAVNLFLKGMGSSRIIQHQLDLKTSRLTLWIGGGCNKKTIFLSKEDAREIKLIETNRECYRIKCF